jgi:spermidine/putrescine transport system permease protein
MKASAHAGERRRHNRLESFTLLFPTTVWLAFFIVIPLSLLIVYSFWIVKNEFVVREFSLVNYFRFFKNSMYPELLWNTAVLALEVSALTFVMGYPLALFISRRTGRARAILYMLVLIPLLTSYIVRIYAMRVILGSNGVINSFLMFLGAVKEPLQFLLFDRFAIFLTLCVILSPFMVMPIFTSLEKIPRSYINASRDLGASDFTTFWRIIFPLSMPGVVAGFMFIFVLTLGDFLTPILVGGTKGMTFGKVIQMNYGIAFDWPFGSALSVILLAVSLVVILLSSRFGALREI